MMGAVVQLPLEDFAWIETFTGKRFHFADAGLDEICLTDIASALSKLCRFGGHCKIMYSVAEHSILLSKWALKHGFGQSLAKQLLFHDASETYLVDVPTPLKNALPEYRVFEAKIDAKIAEKFKLPRPQSPLVATFDARIVMDERRQAMSKSGNRWKCDGLTPLGVTLNFWNPSQAALAFLATAKLLGVEDD